MEKKIYPWFYFITCFTAILILGSIIPANVYGQTCTTTTFSYTGPAVAIPDNNITTGVSIPITVSGVGTINDLNFRLDAGSGACTTTSGDTNASVSHTFLGDLDFTLTSPGGTTLAFMNDNGGGGNNFCTILIDDDGGFPSITTVSTAGAASGNFSPELPLSAFDGQNADGVWTLKVYDDAAGDVGFIRRFSLIICGTPAPTCTPVTVSYTGPAVSIPDNNLSGVNIPLTVAGVGTITDLNFRLDANAGGTCNNTAGNTDASVSHTFLADLDFTLTSPGGTTVAFMSDNGSSGNNFCTLLLDDDGGFPSVTTISTAGAVAGSYAPESPFTPFDGQNADGIWTLKVIDDAGADTGSLRRFSLIFNSCAPLPPTAPANDLCANAVTITCGQTIAGTTTGATAESPAPPACGTYTAPGVWYKFTGNGGTVVISLCSGTTYDSKLSIFSGSCGAFTCVANNDDFCGDQSQISVVTTAATTYYVLVHGFGTNTGAFSLSMTCPPPANDNCSSPTSISCGQTLSGTTVNATTDGVATCGTLVTAAGVWYSFVGTGGNATVSLCSAASYDTKLSVYTGTCGALVCVGGNDDFCSLRSQLTVATTAGTTYRVLVHGFSSATGTFSIALTCAAPVNDLCANALPISCGDTINGSTQASTLDSVGTCTVSNTSGGVWYKFIGDGSFISATTCGGTTNFDTKLSVFTGTCASRTCVTGDDDDGCGLTSLVEFTSTPGTEYYILVHGFSSNTGTFTLTLACITPPANDLCGDAISISCGSAVNGSTLGSGLDNVGTCTVSNTSGGVWYKFVGDGSFISATTCGGITNYDTKISVFTGLCTSLTCVTGDDNDGCGSTSLAEFISTPGTEYYILVHGLSAATGDFTLSLTCTPPAENDLCINATAVTCGDTIEGSTRYSTTDAAGTCTISNTAPGVWYKFTGTGDKVTVSTCGGTTNYDTKLSVFSGACGALTCVEGDDDDGCGLTSELRFCSSTGVDYYILVHGFSSATGNFSLSLTCSAVTATATATSDFNGHNVSCNGDSNGTAAATLSGGLLGPNTYLWSDGQTTAEATGLAAGTYYVTVTDAAGCSATAEVTLTEPAQLTASAFVLSNFNGYNVSCNGGSNGLATAIPGGGTSGFTYTWSNGFIGKSPSGLSAGTYSVTITDANGCTATDSVTLTEPPLLTVDAGANKVVYYGYPDSACASLNPTSAGGIAPHTFAWSTGGSGSINVCPTVTTTYYVTVTDLNGCTAVDSVKVCVIDVRCGNRMDNIILCHATGSGSETICVDINGAKYHLRSHAGADRLGACGTSRTCSFPTTSSKTDETILEEEILFDGGAYLAALPNPFSDQTAIRFTLPDDERASLKLFDVSGKLIAALFEGAVVSGTSYEVTFDGSKYQSGIYFVSLNNSKGERIMKKIVLAK